MNQYPFTKMLQCIWFYYCNVFLTSPNRWWENSIYSIIKTLLKEGGCILIGDVAFQTRSDLEKCHKENKDGWDGDEIYFVVDELRKVFPELEFTQVSYCAGLLVIKK